MFFVFHAITPIFSQLKNIQAINVPNPSKLGRDYVMRKHLPQVRDLYPKDFHYIGPHRQHRLDEGKQFHLMPIWKKPVESQNHSEKSLWCVKRDI
jgi:hypothetical protein